MKKKLSVVLIISLFSFVSCTENQKSDKVKIELLKVSENLNKYLPMETNDMVYDKVTIDDNIKTLSLTYHYITENYTFENEIKPKEDLFQMYYCFQEDFVFFKKNNITVNWKYSNYQGDLLGVYSVNNCK